MVRVAAERDIRLELGETINFSEILSSWLESYNGRHYAWKSI